MVKDPTATERKRRQRLREKLERENKDPLDINQGMKPLIDCFPDQEEWLEANPDKTATDYIKLKIEWEREAKQNERKEEMREANEVNGTIGLVQLNPKTRNQCLRFRRAYIMRDENLGFIHQNHINCKFCDEWLKQYRQTQVINGIDLWGFEC